MQLDFAFLCNFSDFLQDSRPIVIGLGVEGMMDDDPRGREIGQWRELERITPSAESLQRIADKFAPPAEWFDEPDLF